MVDSRQRGLGRGLSALLEEADPVLLSPGRGATAGRGDEAPRELPIELLRRNPAQPRQRFSDADLDDLAQSIRVNGVLQPILVRPAPGALGEYQIVAGERRWRAAQRVGLHLVPVLVRDLADTEVLEMGIVENVQRADLDPIEEASGYQTLIDRFGHTQADVASKVGKSRPHVANALRLLALPAGVREHLQAGRLSAGHARAIASAPNAERLADEIVAKGLSVRQAETLGRGREAATPRGARAAPREAGKSADLRALEGDLSGVLGLAVEIVDRDGAGRVVISYEALEQLDDICRRLMG